MIDNILQTALLLLAITYMARKFSEDDAPFWWQVTLVVSGALSLVVIVITVLIKIWSV